MRELGERVDLRVCKPKEEGVKVVQVGHLQGGTVTALASIISHSSREHGIESNGMGRIAWGLTGILASLGTISKGLGIRSLVVVSSERRILRLTSVSYPCQTGESDVLGHP